MYEYVSYSSLQLMAMIGEIYAMIEKLETSMQVCLFSIFVYKVIHKKLHKV